jgi:hypothetical protein
LIFGYSFGFIPKKLGELKKNRLVTLPVMATEACLLNKISCLAAALGVTKFTNV